MIPNDKYTEHKDEIVSRLNDLCWCCERDGAINVGLWVMNNLKISKKDYEKLNDYLCKEYDFEVDE